MPPLNLHHHTRHVLRHYSPKSVFASKTSLNSNDSIIFPSGWPVQSAYPFCTCWIVHVLLNKATARMSGASRPLSELGKRFAFGLLFQLFGSWLARLLNGYA